MSRHRYPKDSIGKYSACLYKIGIKSPIFEVIGKNIIGTREISVLPTIIPKIANLGLFNTMGIDIKIEEIKNNEDTNKMLNEYNSL